MRLYYSQTDVDDGDVKIIANFGDDTMYEYYFAMLKV